MPQGHGNKYREYRGFARQPCWMAGTIDSFSHGNKCSFFLMQIIFIVLPFNMAAVQNLYFKKQGETST